MKRVFTISVLPVFFISCVSKMERSQTTNWEEINSKNYFLTPIIKDPDLELKNYILADSSQIRSVQNSNDDYKISYGYSFGECYGFCEVEKELSSRGVLIVSKRWKDNFIKTEYCEIDSGMYLSLTEHIDFQNFLSFDEYLGCGDCADWGDEWLTIEHKDRSKTIGGTYGYEVEPVQELLEFLREVEKEY